MKTVTPLCGPGFDGAIESKKVLACLRQAGKDGSAMGRAIHDALDPLLATEEAHPSLAKLCIVAVAFALRVLFEARALFKALYRLATLLRAAVAPRTADRRPTLKELAPDIQKIVDRPRADAGKQTFDLDDYSEDALRHRRQEELRQEAVHAADNAGKPPEYGPFQES